MHGRFCRQPFDAKLVAREYPGRCRSKDDSWKDKKIVGHLACNVRFLKLERKMGRQLVNARAKRTRSALLKAFASLIQSNRYENIEVANIATLAGISRSTFYVHYSSKDSLLADSIAGPLAVLADTIQPVFVESKLVTLLEHFWENRGLTRGILVGPARRKTIEVLI